MRRRGLSGVAYLLLATARCANAGCPDHAVGVERTDVDGGVRFVATARSTSPSSDADDVRTAHAAARLAALELLERADGSPHRYGRLVGVLPLAACEVGSTVFETVAVDPAQTKAADGVADALKRSLVDHPPKF